MKDVFIGWVGGMDWQKKVMSEITLIELITITHTHARAYNVVMLCYI